MNLKLIALFNLILTLLSADSLAQKSRNKKAVRNETRLLRAAILKSQNLNENNVLTSELNYVSRRMDLNGDGRSEYLIWAPTPDFGGTSGYPIIFFARDKKGFREIFKTDAWTPLIVLKSKTNGWRDIAFQTGGGGSDWCYNVLGYDGKTYRLQRTQKKAPPARVLIGQDRNETTFGPLPQ